VLGALPAGGLYSLFGAAFLDARSRCSAVVQTGFMMQNPYWGIAHVPEKAVLSYFFIFEE
jgi:hypothetical protein